MALKHNKSPKPSTREVTLPSEGYPYEKLKGGKLVIKAFNWETETLFYSGGGTSLVKESARLTEVIKRIAIWPENFNVTDLLEGDSMYALLAAKSLSYDERYQFKTMCPACDSEEEHNLIIPDHMPANRYPQDFNGVLKVTTSDGNEVDLRFLTLRDDIECHRLARERVNKSLIPKDSLDADYAINRLCFSLIAANGGKPDTLQESRDFFREMNAVERGEIETFLVKYAPGINSNLSITCPQCGHKYDTVMPITTDFFRSKPRELSTELPRGTRIGTFGDGVGGTDSVTNTSSQDHDRATDRTQGSGEQSDSRRAQEAVVPASTSNALLPVVQTS